MSEHPDEMNFTYGAFISYRHVSGAVSTDRFPEG